jgi:ubiquinone/menaquinone biosynthesis C-methylase UbiE
LKEDSVKNKTIYHQKWYAKEYDQDRFGKQFGHYLESREVETFLSMVDGCAGGILDVGAGTGKLSIPLVRQFRKVTTTDYSTEMLEIALGKAKKEGLMLSPVICDAQHLCFKDKIFGCAVSSRMLMHLGDYKKGIAELCRVASFVVIDFPPVQGFSGFDSFVKRIINKISSRIQKYKVFSVESIKRELINHGFKIVEIQKYYFLPIAFHRRLNNLSLSLKLETLFRKLGLLSLMGAPVIIKAVKNSYVDIENENIAEKTS